MSRAKCNAYSIFKASYVQIIDKHFLYT